MSAEYKLVRDDGWPYFARTVPLTPADVEALQDGFSLQGWATPDKDGDLCVKVASGEDRYVHHSFVRKIEDGTEYRWNDWEDRWDKVEDSVPTFYISLDSIEGEKDDPVDPHHYKQFQGYEPKDAIRAWGLNFNTGSAVKYVARHRDKGKPVEDLRKAVRFLEFEIEALLNEGQ